MRKNLWFQSFIVAAVGVYASMACADSTIYDRNYNVQGYKKESGGTTTVYDKNWNRTGYEKGDKIYDKNWNVKGYRKRDGYHKGYGHGDRSRER
jgi:hypothetical protein